MKKTNIPFCTEIPDTWREVPNKYLFSYCSSKVGSNWQKYQLLSLTTNGVKEKDFNASGGKVPDNYENYQTVKPGDMVFCLFDLDVSAVFSGLSKTSGMITSAYDVVEPNNKFVNKRFIDFWFQYVFSNRYYKMYSKNIRFTIGSDMFMSIRTPVPLLSEQIAIGIYLDKKIKQIEAIIESENNQLSKLFSYKKAIINDVVINGLDKNCIKKNSNIEWIGEIPAHWVLMNGKYVFKLLDRNVEANDKVVTCFRDGQVTLRSNRREEGFTFSEKEIGYQGIEPGDLVVHGMDGFAGAIGISDSRGKGSPVLIVLDTIYDKRYLMYYLRSLAYRDIFVALSTGIRVRTCDLRWNKLSSLPIVVPPMDEQKNIVEYINNKCDLVDKLILVKKEKIHKLEEYKTALIYEYVTGKEEVAYEI